MSGGSSFSGTTLDRGSTLDQLDSMTLGSRMHILQASDGLFKSCWTSGHSSDMGMFDGGLGRGSFSTRATSHLSACWISIFVCLFAPTTHF